MALKYFKITVKNDGKTAVVLDEKGRRLLGVKSISRLETNPRVVFIKMKFRDVSSDPLCFTISPLFEEKYCAAMRHCDEAMLANVRDIIMHEDCSFTMVINENQKGGT